MADKDIIHWRRVFDALVGVLLLTALVLSGLSWWEVCTTACAEGHKYRFFGFHFEQAGIAFFSMALLVYAASFYSQAMGWLLRIMIFGMIGAEIWFLYIQRYVIGNWCPLCLAIAACITTIGVIFFVQFWRDIRRAIQAQNRSLIMGYVWRGLGSISALVIGFIVAFAAVAKEEHSFAAADSIVFGDKQSPIQVYVFEDWFCPACRKAQPALEKLYPQIMQKAQLIFIDVPIHADSFNFVPYNLSFLLKNKDKYLQLRHDLQDLAEKNNSPTDSDIETLAKKHGAQYAQIGGAQIEQGKTYFKQMTKKFKVENTPTVIVYNPKTNKAKKLVGLNDISKANMLVIIDSMKKK